MNSSLRDRLWAFAAGTLDDGEREEMRALLDAQPALSQELAVACEALGIALGPLLPAIAPSPGTRGRLLDAVHGEERHTPFAPRAAALLDLPLDETVSALRTITREDGWSLDEGFGLFMRPIASGKARAEATCAVMRMPPGHHVPLHVHHGLEQVLVMRGGYTNVTTGEVLRAGSTAESAKGSAHEARAHDDDECVCLVILHGALEIVPAH